MVFFYGNLGVLGACISYRSVLQYVQNICVTIESLLCFDFSNLKLGASCALETSACCVSVVGIGYYVSPFVLVAVPLMFHCRSAHAPVLSPHTTLSSPLTVLQRASLFFFLFWH